MNTKTKRIEQEDTRPKRHCEMDRGDLDYYLFNREARMYEAWGTERVGAAVRSDDGPQGPRMQPLRQDKMSRDS